MKMKQWNENILNIKEKYFRCCTSFKYMSFASASVLPVSLFMWFLLQHCCAQFKISMRGGGFVEIASRCHI